MYLEITKPIQEEWNFKRGQPLSGYRFPTLGLGLVEYNLSLGYVFGIIQFVFSFVI